MIESSPSHDASHATSIGVHLHLIEMLRFVLSESPFDRPLSPEKRNLTTPHPVERPQVIVVQGIHIRKVIKRE